MDLRVAEEVRKAFQSHIPLEVTRQVLSQFGHNNKVTSSKSLDILAATVLKSGVEVFFRNCDSNTQDVLTSAEGKPIKEIEQTMATKGIISFLDQSKVSTLRQLCRVLGVDPLYRKGDTLSEHSQRVNHIADEIMLGGMEHVLLTVNNSVLQGLAKEFGVKQGSRDIQADSILMKIFHLKPVKSQKKDDPPKRKLKDPKEDHRPTKKRKQSKYQAPPLSNIKAGISRQDLHDLYNLSHLQQFCKSHSLDASGKKSLLIKRIISFLESGEPPETKRKKRGRSKSHR